MNARRTVVDPSVADLLNGLNTQAAQRSLPAKERRKASKARQKAKDRLPRRVNWDLPETIKDQVTALAERHECPASQMAAVLLLHGLAAMRQGDILLDDYKRPSSSPRYTWNLVIQENHKNAR